MKTEIFALCDAATQSGGKLNILGAFDAIHARQIPATHPFCSLALRLRFDRIEEGDHRIRINIVDEDGRLVMPSIDANLNVQMGADGTNTTCVNLVLAIQQLKFEQYGEYAIQLAVDGRSEASLPLFVRQVAGPS